MARELGIPAQRVERWRGRFLRMRLKGLEDRPRRGRKGKFSPVARLEIISLACEPVRVRDGRTRRDVRTEAIARGVAETISWSSVQRILSAGDVRPHMMRGWMHSQDPQFRESWTRFNERNGDRFVFHYTPKHASWVNQVELFFSILQRQCLTHGSFPSVEALRAAVLDFIAYWNREAGHPFRWTFTGYPLQAGVDLPRTA